MRAGYVYVNDRFAGVLTETDEGKYIFEYDDAYLNDTTTQAVCSNLPKKQKVFESDYLFPYFSNILSEGENREFRCRLLHIDPDDSFGLLLATAQYDTIGNVTIKPANQ